MNLLFCELLYPHTHIRSNSFYLQCLSELDLDLFVLSPENFYSVDRSIGTFINVEELPISKGKLSYRLSALRYSKKIIKIIKEYKIDKIILASSDYIVLSWLVKKLPQNTKLYLIHHAELDSLKTNRIKRAIFALYKEKIEHLVFEEYMKEYLVNEQNIPAEIINVMPHSLNKNRDNKNEEEYLINLVGISNSNSEEMINKLITLEKEKGIFKNNNLKVVLKSKEKVFYDGFLKVVCGYLADDEYNGYISNTEFIFIPFPNDFGLRESGTLMDAMSNHKKVIASTIKLMEYYKVEYPHICFTFNNIENLIDILTSKNINEMFCEDEFEKFETRHNKNSYKAIMRKILDV